MEEDFDVTYPTAAFFYDQCCGDYNGHMEAIPNSPVLHSLAVAHGVNTKEKFAAFLREIANQLDGGGHV